MNVWQKSVAVRQLNESMQMLTSTMTKRELREAVLALTERIAPALSRKDIEEWHADIQQTIKLRERAD